MQENPLEIRLEALVGRAGYYRLSFDSFQYILPFNPEANVALSIWLRHLPSALVGRTDPGEPLAPEQLLQEVGTWLWRALLPASAPEEEREALAHALRNGTSPLLLKLPDALSGLPWELLYDPEQADGSGFLARRRPLMRLTAPTSSVAAIAPPLRVLLLISSPVGLREASRVDVESERAAVERATREMREAGLLHLLVEDIVSPKRVQQALVRFKPHLLHYIGHGGYDKESGGMLLWRMITKASRLLSGRQSLLPSCSMPAKQAEGMPELAC